jgi:hypothetical protein
MQAILVSLIIVVATGCEHLIVYEDDSSGMAVGKVATRTLLGLSTIGLSEMGMNQYKDRLEQQAYPITSGSHVSNRAKNQILRFMVTGNHSIATAEVQQILVRKGHTVVERNNLEAIQEEQRLRLRQTADHEADALHVGKLSGADRIVFVEATVRPARFGISLVPHYALSVTVRTANTETGQITWQGAASYSSPIADPDASMGSLTAWAVRRAICPLEDGAQWIEPGPYRKRADCVKPTDQ